MRQRLLRLLAVMAPAVAALCAGGALGHAATTTTVAANYNYDHPAKVAQRAFGNPVGQAHSSVPGSVRLQERRAAFGLAGRARVAAEAGAGEIVDVAVGRVALRVGTRAEIRAAAPKTATGDFIDPNTGQILPKDGPFHYGHKPGFEWWRTQRTAREQGWTREELIEYENNPSHYQIEDPRANLSHKFEMPR